MDITQAQEILEENKLIDTRWDHYGPEGSDRKMSRYEVIEDLHMTGYYLTENAKGREVLRSFSTGYPQKSTKWIVELWKAYCTVNGSQTMFVLSM